MRLPPVFFLFCATSSPLAALSLVFWLSFLSPLSNQSDVPNMQIRSCQSPASICGCPPIVLKINCKSLCQSPRPFFKWMHLSTDNAPPPPSSTLKLKKVLSSFRSQRLFVFCSHCLEFLYPGSLHKGMPNVTLWESPSLSTWAGYSLLHLLSPLVASISNDHHC